MRLIDLDELLKFPIRLDTYDKKNGNKHFVFGIESVLEYAENLPIVDAVEVVRSKWVEAEDIGDCCYACLNCGFIRDGYLSYPANYCPNCGAKMEEDR